MDLKFKRTASAALFLTACAFYARGLAAPALQGRINDYAEMISPADEAELESSLAALEEATGAQIAVLTIRSLEGEDLEEYGVRVAESWRLGQKGRDNGALLLVSLDDRKVRIETGYGMEGSLTDTKCGLIIRNVIIPEFRAGDYSRGIVKGVQEMINVASGGESLAASKKGASGNSGADGVLFGFLFIFGWFILFSCLASGPRNHFLPWIIFSRSFRASHRGGGRAGFYPGGGFHGGGSFHGGGGGFGGGGASGGW